MFLIDTLVLSEPRKPRPDKNVVAWMARQRPEDLFISVITVMEVARGAQKQKSANPAHAEVLEAWLARNISLYRDRILPVTTEIASRWGRMQIELGRDDDDIAIAATALEHGLTVVTRNVRHFDSTGVTVLNPFDAL